MDEKHFEHAAQVEQAMRDKAIDRARRKEAEMHKRPEGFNGSCPSCGESIPEARIEAGYFICVPCKELEERCQKLIAPNN